MGKQAETRKAGWGFRSLLPALLYGIFGLFFVGGFLGQYQPEGGYTKFILFGSHFEAHRLSTAKAVPRAVTKDSFGYDGQWYAQLALSPLLRDPELREALDSPAYRSRRILSAWTAYLLGVGQPAWVLQAYAFQNLLFWVLLGWLMTRWLPPENWRSGMGWLGCMGCFGTFESCGRALPDLSAMFLIAGMLYFVERQQGGRAATVLALGALAKETTLLAGVALPRLSGDSPAQWLREGLKYLPVLLPFVLWLGYVTVLFGTDVLGTANFNWPLVGYVWKAKQVLGDLPEPYDYDFRRYTNLFPFVAMSVQALFFLLRPRWDDRWWRVGGVYAILMIVLGRAVWEGVPGSYSRVLMPMTFAFNVLLPHGSRWFWPVWMVGNLSLISTLVHLWFLWV